MTYTNHWLQLNFNNISTALFLIYVILFRLLEQVTNDMLWVITKNATTGSKTHLFYGADEML